MTADLFEGLPVFSAGYGDVRVLHDVDITVKAGEIVCLIGSNGGGKKKTTLLRTLSGMATAAAGSVTFAEGKTCSDYRRRRSFVAASPHVPEGQAFVRRHDGGATIS